MIFSALVQKIVGEAESRRTSTVISGNGVRGRHIVSCITASRQLRTSNATSCSRLKHLAARLIHATPLLESPSKLDKDVLDAAVIVRVIPKISLRYYVLG